MKVDIVDPRFEGSVTTTEPRAQRIADAIVAYEISIRDLGDTFTVYEIVTKYGLGDILGSYSYTGRAPINVADQVVRNAINDAAKTLVVVATEDRRKGYVVYEVTF